MVSLSLCKEYLNMLIFKNQNTSLTPDKELNIFIYGTPSYVITYTGTMSGKKIAPFYFCNNFVKYCYIGTIIGVHIP